jgi:hypothetical protein
MILSIQAGTYPSPDRLTEMMGAGGITVLMIPRCRTFRRAQLIQEQAFPVAFSPALVAGFLDRSVHRLVIAEKTNPSGVRDFQDSTIFKLGMEYHVESISTVGSLSE